MSDKKRPFYKPGWYPDLSNEEYHGSFGYGSTTLKILNEKTKAHLDYQQRQPPKMTDALVKGQLLHTMVLEPHLVEKEFIILPEFNLRTKAGKQEKLLFEDKHQGKIFVTKAQFNNALYMSRSIFDHPVIGQWFNDDIKRFVEQSVYYWYQSEDWDDKNDYKTMFKVRPDLVFEGMPVIFDLKSTRDASFSKFMRQAKQLGYHMSAAMYMDGATRCEEFKDEVGVMAFTDFCWIVVENEPPYCATYYEASKEDIQEGRAMYHALARKMELYNRSEWKGYGAQDTNGLITPEGRKSEIPKGRHDIV